MNPSAKPEQLYIVTFKCAHCMRVLGHSRHQSKIQTGRWTRANFKPCPEHPNYGFVAEWEPEQEQEKEVSYDDPIL